MKYLVPKKTDTECDSHHNPNPGRWWIDCHGAGELLGKTSSNSTSIIIHFCEVKLMCKHVKFNVYFLRPSTLPWVGHKMDITFLVETNNLESFFLFLSFFFLVWNRNYSKLYCIKRHYQITFQAHFRRWGLLRIHQFGSFLTEVSKCWRHNSYQIVLNLYTIILFLF